MRAFRALAVSGLLMAASGGALAQSAAVGGGPAELPPAGYEPRFYVDSRGCMFIRAGGNGQARWLPQVARDLKPVCGLSPTLAAGSAAAPQPVATASSAATAPAPNRAADVRTATPDGWMPAWDDGRLNPLRGPRGTDGERTMAQVWNIWTVPMRRYKRGEYVGHDGSVRVSSKSAASAGGHWVQVGAFGAPGNARAAQMRLERADLPAASRTAAGGLTLVMAGPFDSPGAARAARAQAAALGFTDAYLR